MTSELASTRSVLLRRRGLVFAEGDRGETLPERYVKAVEVEWAALGYVPSARLSARLARLSLDELAAVRSAVVDTIAAMVGAHVKHEPLFRSFPDGVPDDTFDLWVRRVIVLFLQAPEQPCLFCCAIGTTHVLSPCHHVVCDRCFDGSNYSACPVCEARVDRDSPFFEPLPPRTASPRENPRLRLLDLGGDLLGEARALFTSFCERKQAMSPADRFDLESIVLDAGETILAWLPEKIPVKENLALVFGALFTVVDPAIVLPVAERHFKTATDVLRFLAVISGADASLLPQPRHVRVDRLAAPPSLLRRFADLVGVALARKTRHVAYVTLEVRRFKMARLGRPLRRALLALLEGFPADTLIEDMLRHRSYWVWAGEFLHPHEYAKRFPHVARAFAVVRRFAPDGTPAPRFAGFAARLEAAAQARDAAAMVRILRERPGELGRRFDHALRVAGDQPDPVVDAFVEVGPRLSTPVLLTLHTLLPSRLRAGTERVYWPKGDVTSGFYAPDVRPPLPPRVVRPAAAATTAELLRRFAGKPALDEVLVDSELARIVVPFNERTASRSAVSLPRGSVVPVPRDKIVRMFLHWCEPEKGGTRTDIDLSVGFYRDDWQEAGVCSFYQRKVTDGAGHTVAASSGDLTSAPFPDGASEFIDLFWDRALAHGVRYAVMVVNNYSGMPFSLLERGFAGLMLRDDAHGLHFDPRTVELKLDLRGDNGIYLPLVLDLREGVLHWLDVYSAGRLLFNSVASSRRAITTICPTLISYFASGIRPSMFDLVLLHAAARARTVYLRGMSTRRFERAEGEDAAAFHARLQRGDGGERVREAALGAPGTRALAALFRGDLALPDGVDRYVLFPDRVTGTMAASDLIS